MKNTNKILLGIGILFGVWSLSAIIGGIIASGGIAPLASSYMTASGLVTPLYTLVDYYTHIKGIEYLICVAFFVAFPMFFKYINKSNVELTESKVKA